MTQPAERLQDRLDHDLILPEETLTIRAKARAFANRFIAPRAYENATISGTDQVSSIMRMVLWKWHFD